MADKTKGATAPVLSELDKYTAEEIKVLALTAMKLFRAINDGSLVSNPNKGFKKASGDELIEMVYALQDTLAGGVQ